VYDEQLMKILRAAPGFSPQLTEQEIVDFLTNSNLNAHLGTLDDKNEPNIHPVWYYYNSLKDKIYIETAKASKKLSNIRKNKTVYFCIDEPNLPYKGVRGKGKVTIHEDVDFNVPISEKIMIKYLGGLQHPMAIMLLEEVKNGNSVMLEITPDYYSTWDNGKQT
jgi:general stress protein 26